MLTVYSSLIFVSAALHLLHAKELVQFHLFYALGVVSIINHATLGRPFRLKSAFLIVDKALIAASTVHGGLRSFQLARQYRSAVPLLLYLPPMAWIHYVYNVGCQSFLSGEAWKPWHASLHLSVGVPHHLLLLWLSHVSRE